MNLNSLRPKNLLAYIATRFGEDGRYFRFGQEDNFPNKVLESINDSGMARLCIDRLNQFLYGYGVKDKNVGDRRINEDQNLDSFLRETTAYVNYLGSYAWLHKYNAYGKIVNSFVLPSQYVRVKYDGDYIYAEGLGDPQGQRDMFLRPITYPKFNPNATPQEIRAEIARQKSKHGEQIGFIQYEFNGGVGLLYEKYSVPTHAAGLNDLNADSAQSLQEESIAVNSFKAEVVIVTGNIDNEIKDENEQTANDRFVEELENFTSADGSPVLHLTKRNEEDVQVFPLDVGSSRESRLASSRERVSKIIARLFSVPPVLVGIDTAGKLGDNQELVNKLKLFNLTIGDKRELLLRGLKKMYKGQEELLFEMEELDLFDFIPDSVLATLSDAEKRSIYNIPEIESEEDIAEEVSSRFGEFGVGGVTGILSIQTAVANQTIKESAGVSVLQSIYGFPEDVARSMLGSGDAGLPAVDEDGLEIEEVKPIEETTNKLMREMTGRQLQGIQRVVRKFNKDELTKAQAKQLLQSSYGMTDEQVEEWLIEESEEDGTD